MTYLRIIYCKITIGEVGNLLKRLFPSSYLKEIFVGNKGIAFLGIFYVINHA